MDVGKRILKHAITITTRTLETHLNKTKPRFLSWFGIWMMQVKSSYNVVHCLQD